MNLILKMYQSVKILSTYNVWVFFKGEMKTNFKILIKKDNNIYLIQGIGVNIFPIIDSDELILFGNKLKNSLIDLI